MSTVDQRENPSLSELLMLIKRNLKLLFKCVHATIFIVFYHCISLSPHIHVVIAPRRVLAQRPKPEEASL